MDFIVMSRADMFLVFRHGRQQHKRAMNYINAFKKLGLHQVLVMQFTQAELQESNIVNQRNNIHNQLTRRFDRGNVKGYIHRPTESVWFFWDWPEGDTDARVSGSARVNALAALDLWLAAGDEIKPEACRLCQREADVEPYWPDHDYPQLFFWLCESCLTNYRQKQVHDWYSKLS